MSKILTYIQTYMTYIDRVEEPVRQTDKQTEKCKNESEKVREGMKV